MSMSTISLISLALPAVVMLAGCNSASMEDLQRVEAEVADLRARLDAVEDQTDASVLSSDSALDSANQCNDVCRGVSDRLDELYLRTTQP